MINNHENTTDNYIVAVECMFGLPGQERDTRVRTLHYSHPGLFGNKTVITSLIVIFC